MHLLSKTELYSISPLGIAAVAALVVAYWFIFFKLLNKLLDRFKPSTVFMLYVVGVFLTFSPITIERTNFGTYLPPFTIGPNGMYRYVVTIEDKSVYLATKKIYQDYLVRSDYTKRTLTFEDFSNGAIEQLLDHNATTGEKIMAYISADLYYSSSEIRQTAEDLAALKSRTTDENDRRVISEAASILREVAGEMYDDDEDAEYEEEHID